MPKYICSMDELDVDQDDKDRKGTHPFAGNHTRKKCRLSSPSQETTISTISELSLVCTNPKVTVTTDRPPPKCFICNIPVCPRETIMDGFYQDPDVVQSIRTIPNHPKKNSLLRYFSTTKSPTETSHGNHNLSHAYPTPCLDLEPCTFCDRHVCKQRCIRVCESCQCRFCTFCSTINYNDRLERIYCLDCNHSMNTSGSSSSAELMDLS
jgi:hypothetical protein